MPLLLVIDDDPLMQRRVQRDFEETAIEVRLASSARQGFEILEAEPVDAILMDVMLPDMSGLDAFQQLHEQASRVPVIFITAGTESTTAIEAMKLGAYDYLMKPLDREQLRKLVQKAIEQRRISDTPVDLLEPPAEPGGAGHDALVGRCLSMQDVYKKIGRIASQDITVLITGESGTGKELVARAIYQHSHRADGPFLAINCAAIPESLLESELFGHEKGAFTGADQLRIGKFEQCSGGTLFLDEIGDMSPQTQSKVLRVLQEQRFERVGGMETIQTDVRVIAATNRDLQALVADSQFRQDLFYRLNDYRIHLPPLRERKDDLPLLMNHFLNRFNQELSRQVRGASPEALELLLDYPWPGNIREFQSVLKQALLHARGEALLPDHLEEALGAEATPAASAGNDWETFVQQRLHSGSGEVYAECVRRLDRLVLTRTLQFTGGNQLQASRILGITRGTLRNKMRDLGITVEKVIDEEPGSEEELV